MAYIDRMDNQFKEVEIKISMRCAKHFLPEFIAMLNRMEDNGKVGHSEWLAIYSDGDGAMRPTFKYEVPSDILEAAKNPRFTTRDIHCPCYDAG